MRAYVHEYVYRVEWVCVRLCVHVVECGFAFPQDDAHQGPSSSEAPVVPIVFVSFIIIMHSDWCEVLKFGTLIWNGLLIIVSKVSCPSLKLYSATKASKLEVRLRPQLLNRETIFLN